MIWLPPGEMERRRRAGRRRRLWRGVGEFLFRVVVLCLIAGGFYAWYSKSTPRQWLDAALTRWRAETRQGEAPGGKDPSDPPTSDPSGETEGLTRDQLYIWDANAVSDGARAVIPTDLWADAGLPAQGSVLPDALRLEANGEIQVVILHAHSREAYLSPDTRSVDWSTSVGRARVGETAGTVVGVGQTLAAALEARGIGVLHLNTAFDASGNAGAFDRAREATEEALRRYPHVRLVIDLHRDAGVNEDGDILRAVTLCGQPAQAVAQLRCTAASGDASALAAALYGELNRRAEHLCRPPRTTTDGWTLQNGDGTAVTAIRVEMGTTGNSQGEADAAAQILAQALCALLGAER